ncbi:hypothetical protein D3C80_1017510 [compost metagenome]
MNKSPYAANTSAKYVSTTAPKIIGSETFIIVAFKCADNNTPAAFASAIASTTKPFNAFKLKVEVSITSPAFNGDRPFNSVTAPCASTNSILN